MREFRYGYVKSKYEEKAKLYYMDTTSFIVYIKIEDIFADIAEDVEITFDTLNYELDRPWSQEKKESNWFNER